MEVSATGSMAGLSATGEAIRTAQQRFNAQAQAVVDTTTDLASDQPVASESLVNGVVGLREEQALNGVLFGVFKRQMEQQQTLLELIPRP